MTNTVDEFEMFEIMMGTDPRPILGEFDDRNNRLNSEYPITYQNRHGASYFFLTGENKKSPRHCKFIRSNETRSFMFYDYTVNKWFDHLYDWAKDCGAETPKLLNINYGRNAKNCYTNLESLVAICDLRKRSCIRMITYLNNESTELMMKNIHVNLLEQVNRVKDGVFA